MTRTMLAAGALLVALGTTVPAHAQGVPGGAAYGASRGNEAAGPVGAVVGGVVGGVIGGVEGVLGVTHPASYEVQTPRYYRHPRGHVRHARRFRHRHHTGAA